MDGDLDGWATVPSKKKGKKKKEEVPEEDVKAAEPAIPEPEKPKEKAEEKPKEKADEKPKAKNKPKEKAKAKPEAKPDIQAENKKEDEAPAPAAVEADNGVMTAKKIKKAIKTVQTEIEQLEIDKQKTIEKWDADIQSKYDEAKSLRWIMKSRMSW